MMKKMILATLALVVVAKSANSQNVNIPDANFKAYLVGNTAINTNSDAEIQVSEASSFTGAINCFNLGISSLTGIEYFTSATGIRCQMNQLTTLDVSQNTGLVTLNFSDNNLTYCNVANGFNTNMGAGDFNGTNNPNLTCVNVDNLSWSNTAWFGWIDSGASFSTNCPPCIINIPDANFKSYLVGNSAINTNGDTEIQCSEASSYSGIISCPNLSIADLTGIEAFTSVNLLYCNGNLLTSIDLSSNSALTTLYCNDNQLSTLALSDNPLLSNLHCDNNLLTSLDVTTNPNLQYLHCYENQISTLDISQNSALEELVTGDNNLTSIDVTSNTSLELIDIDQNQISNIDLSQNSALQDFYARNNLLTTLDFSNNTLLDWIVVNGNPNLESIDISNGNNTIVSFFWAHNSPNLTCIAVDDVAYSTANWQGSSFNFDMASSFNLNCASVCTVNIPDANFKAYLVGNTAINTNGDTDIQCSEATTFTGMINCSSLNISDLTGIEEFVNIVQLNFLNNNVSSVDLSNNTSLTTLNCEQNQLTSIDVSSNLDLTSLSCGNNNAFSSLDLSNNPDLEYLRCVGIQLTSLDLSNNTALSTLHSAFNSITDLDLTINNSLTYVDLENNNLNTLNIQNGTNTDIAFFYAEDNPNLTCIQVDDVAYSTTNWTDIDSQTSFSLNCSGGGASLFETENIQLNIYPNPTKNKLFIETLNAEINETNILDISGKVIHTQNNSVKSVDVSDLSTGVYLIRVYTTNGISTQRFIKQ